jgi:hypothetical protein
MKSILFYRPFSSLLLLPPFLSHSMLFMWIDTNRVPFPRIYTIYVLKSCAKLKAKLLFFLLFMRIKKNFFHVYRFLLNFLPSLSPFTQNIIIVVMQKLSFFSHLRKRNNNRQQTSSFKESFFLWKRKKKLLFLMKTKVSSHNHEKHIAHIQLLCIIHNV